jgi:pantoate--beta-alanine ligase
VASSIHGVLWRREWGRREVGSSASTDRISLAVLLVHIFMVDFSKAKAQVLVGPLRLKHLSTPKWTVHNPKEAAFEVLPGLKVELVDGGRINFGKTQAEIKFSAPVPNSEPWSPYRFLCLVGTFDKEDCEPSPTAMQILNSIAAVRAARPMLRESGRSLSLVPTMGALHQGHLSLVRAAREAGRVRPHDAVAVSIFVNPAQFGPNEDFSLYPRTLDADCALLQSEGVDMVFAPSAAEMYPTGAMTRVHVGGMSERLDGASRPGHFDGVATVVSKLFHILEPQRAFFGQKDAAQVAVLQAMVRDLDSPVELVICPTVREPDGLAMSSRNRYLSPDERRQALVLSRAVLTAEALVAGGEVNAATLIHAAQRLFATEAQSRIDYIAVVDPLTLLPVDMVRGETLFAVAAYLGATRLIDNTVLRLPVGRTQNHS